MTAIAVPTEVGQVNSPRPKQDEESVSLPRISIDMKVPLWGLAGAAAIGLGGLMSMYYQLLRVSDDITELKTNTRAITTNTLLYTQEQAVLKFRVEKLEEDKRNRQ